MGTDGSGSPRAGCVIVAGQVSLREAPAMAMRRTRPFAVGCVLGCAFAPLGRMPTMCWYAVSTRSLLVGFLWNMAAVTAHGCGYLRSRGGWRSALCIAGPGRVDQERGAHEKNTRPL